MTKYVIRYTIDGTFTCEASSHEEAQEMFEAMTKAELGEDGDLVADDAKTAAEYAAEIEATSTPFDPEPASPA